MAGELMAFRALLWNQEPSIFVDQGHTELIGVLL